MDNPAPVAPGADRRTPVVVVAGTFGPAAARVDQVATALGAAAGTVVVRHHLGELREGIVQRTVRDSDREQRSVLELAHGCVSCTLRADLLPLLCTLAARDRVRRIVLALDPAFEAEEVCRAIDEFVVAGMVGRVDGPAARDVRVEAVLTCLDAPSWLSDATGEETLAERGRATADDDRTVAQLAVGQVGFADALVLFGTATMDPLENQRLGAVLKRLVPAAPVLHADSGMITATGVEELLAAIPDDSRRGEIFDAHAPLLRDSPPLVAEYGVALIEFAAARPFHPVRLHEALDVLFEGVVTARGRLWLATQPEEVVWLESAGGGLRVGGAGRWLAAMEPGEREKVDPDRLALAALRWDDRFGDRDVSLVILVHDADPEEIRRALHWALVDDAELRLVERSPERVARWADPFGEWHADLCESAETAATPPSGESGDHAWKER